MPHGRERSIFDCVLKRTSATIVLVTCGLVLAISLGTRHTFGLFLAPMTLSFDWGRETFAFAIALMNLVWGLSQPFVGALADTRGAYRVMTAGALLYGGGLLLMTVSTSAWQLASSAGLLIGLALSCTTFAVVNGAIGRAFAGPQLSIALGIAGAAGSFGQFAMLPYGHVLIEQVGWRDSLLVLAASALVMAPLAWLLRRMPAAVAVVASAAGSARAALGEALRHVDFWLLNAGFFVCGFQVTFIATHLPAYLSDRGIQPGVAATALGLIGLFNIAGSYLCGWLGARVSKRALLSGVYLLRALVILWALVVPLSVASVLVFAGTIGLLWLGTVPLTAGIIARIFGTAHLAMLFGITFMFHQLGSFVGVWVGGHVFDAAGSYRTAWILCVGLGLVAAMATWPIREQPPAGMRDQGA